MAAPFWKDGLRFACARCSACCRHEPGFVFLSSSDARRLFERSGLAFRDFFATLLRTVDIGTGYAVSLQERPNRDCILWSSSGCLAYDARPLQCSTYPFWQAIVESPEAWEREGQDCPGIGSGHLISAESIVERLLARRSETPILLSYDVDLESLDEDTLLGSPRLSSDPADPGAATE